MIGAGFADPAEDAHRVFRGILRAISHPGRVERLLSQARCPGLGAGAAAVALALADADTPVWLGPGLGAAEPSLRFHCTTPIISHPGAAVFAFADAREKLPPLRSFSLGTDAYPDRATTLVLEVAALESGAKLRLSGPGIDGSVRLDAAGVPPGFWAERADLQPLFPRGLDLLLVAGPMLAALPRTTVVEE